MLTGGPCGGKTTGQAHLATFFESLGWKVFRVPETATVLMSGGISFGELNEEQVRFVKIFLALFLINFILKINLKDSKKYLINLTT